MAIDFEALINKQVGEDGNIPAANFAKLASTISSAVGREFVAKERYNAKLDEIETLKGEKQTAEDSATAAGKWETKYKALKEEFDTFKTDTEAKAKLSEIKAAYRKLLTDEGISTKFIDAVMKATQFEGMKLSADGQLEKADELKTAINNDWGDFKATTTQQGARVDTPPKSTNQPMSKADIFAKDEHGRYKLSTAERQAALMNAHKPTI